MEVHNAEALRSSEKFRAYELEDADEALVNDLASFALTNAIYATLVEGHASEICARRNAMDNASKNAGEMIDKLQMQFNRQRQAVITNELVDIIVSRLFCSFQARSALKLAGMLQRESMDTDCCPPPSSSLSFSSRPVLLRSRKRWCAVWPSLQLQILRGRATSCNCRENPRENAVTRQRILPLIADFM